MKIGFLPLYIELYDKVGSATRQMTQPFYDRIAADLSGKGIEVITNDFCRLEDEFKAAVKKFEKENVDAIVTWHAAYSPSLESVEALTKTDLPIIVLDTTEVFDFSPVQAPTAISNCHGIHGVMDMCNLLNRHNKTFAIVAGHYPESDVLDRAVGYIKAAVAAKALKGSKVGRIGTSFKGMGDFLISDEDLMSIFGVEAVTATKEELEEIKATVTDAEIDNEVKNDLDGAKKLSDFDEATHKLTAKNCITVRKWIEKNGLSAFTANFLDINSECGLDVMPFMEAGKAMARGIGYAGEGDVLTASLTGALIKGFDTASFVEIFCPDWKGNTLFLSHMGEANYALGTDKPSLMEVPFIYTDAQNPIAGYTCYKKGEATFVNLYPTADGYSLLLAPVTMEEPSDVDNFQNKIRGWMRPNMPIAEFLEKISIEGVTHHSSLIYGATPSELEFFGKLIGVKVVVI